MLARQALSSVAANLPERHTGVLLIAAQEVSCNISAGLFHASCTNAASRPGPAPVPRSTPVQARPAGAKPASNQLVSQPSDSTWTPVVHQQSGLTYYWNKSTGETTALGEPLPGPDGRQSAPRVISPAPSLLGLVATGAGFGLVFGIMGHLIG
ncbi:hypothetical protein WJX74_007000 [Apatococcus lobatus]|uniref:Uncharacterized protein n=1 Tax=Apatococcus lobatus TaxID=904363 RepID=A0AAW1RZY5_9CHLO